MLSLQRSFLQAALVLILLSAVIALCAIFVDFNGFFAKLVAVAYITAFYMLLGWCSARLLSKDIYQKFAVTGLIVILLGYVLVLLLLFGGSGNPSGLYTYVSWLRDEGILILLATLYPLSAAQASLLLLPAPRTAAVSNMRKATLAGIAAVCLVVFVAVLMRSSLGGDAGINIAKLGYICYVLSIFGTITTMILHQLSKHSISAAPLNMETEERDII